MVGSVIIGHVQNHPEYRPVEIRKDMQRQIGVKVSYWTAWAAKKHAVDKINGSHEDAYVQIPQYCSDIMSSNPGSIVHLEHTAKNHFL